MEGVAKAAPFFCDNVATNADFFAQVGQSLSVPSAKIRV
jgi:hypothetical protein